jgi:homoserine kinase type II
MAVYTQVPAEALAVFLERYDVGTLRAVKGIAEGVENSNYLVDTSGADGQGARFILTLYEKRVDAGDLPYFMALLDHLAGKGLPVPPAIKDREGREIQELQGRPACLIRFLSGVSLSHPTPVQARAAARQLARMHKAVADFPRERDNSMGFQTWKPLWERCGRGLDGIAPGFHDDLGFAIGDLSSAWWYGGEFDRCAIHADLFPDNVLMTGDEVSGLIDFYFACSDVRIYDLAIMHAAWSFDVTGAHFDAAIGEALIAGYEAELPLSDAERQALYSFASGACLRFTLSRAWDWLNTPPDAMVTRKDPLAFWRRLKVYDPKLAGLLGTLR